MLCVENQYNELLKNLNSLDNLPKIKKYKLLCYFINRNSELNYCFFKVLLYPLLCLLSTDHNTDFYRKQGKG